MIKSENYGKITENSRNLPENSLKNPKNFRRASLGDWGGGGPALPDRGDFSDFSMTGGILGWSPLFISD